MMFFRTAPREPWRGARGNFARAERPSRRRKRRDPGRLCGVDGVLVAGRGRGRGPLVSRVAEGRDDGTERGPVASAAWMLSAQVRAHRRVAMRAPRRCASVASEDGCASTVYIVTAEPQGSAPPRDPSAPRPADHQHGARARLEEHHGREDPRFSPLALHARHQHPHHQRGSIASTRARTVASFGMS